MDMGGYLIFDVVTRKWSLGSRWFGGALERRREGKVFGSFQEIRAFGPWIGGIPGYSGVVEA